MKKGSIADSDIYLGNKLQQVKLDNVTEFQPKKPCLTLTLMGERQDANPNTTLNGYIMEFWKFDLTWKLKCPMQQK